MASKKGIVNLDALISREDLEVSEEATFSPSKITSISTNELKVDSGLLLRTCLVSPEQQ